MENKTKIGLEVAALNFQNVDYTPTYKEDKKAGIVKYGNDNLFPDFLLDLYVNGSAKHSAIINKKISMGAGQGFEKIKTPALLKFVDNMRGSHQMEDLFRLLYADLEVFSAFALLVRWNSDKSKIAAIDYVPVHKVRKGIAENTWFVSDNWQHYKKSESNTRMYKSFDASPLPSNFENYKPEDKRLHLAQLVYFKDLSIGCDHYPNVSYQGTIKWILADQEIANFTLNNLQNNFVGGYHIHFPSGIPEEHEMAYARKRFTEEHTGSSANPIVMTWGEEEQKPVSLTPLPTTGNEEAYLNVEEQIRNNIFIGHSVTNPMLFGIMTPGSLGSKDELLESLEIFNSTYVRPRQTLVENVLNRLARVNEIEESIVAAEYQIVKKEEKVEEEEVNNEAEAEKIEE